MQHPDNFVSSQANYAMLSMALYYPLFYSSLFVSIVPSPAEDICNSGDHECHRHATCALTNSQDGGYKCTCKMGFIGDGNNCIRLRKFPYIKIFLVRMLLKIKIKVDF